jgi:hypothetical protein
MSKMRAVVSVAMVLGATCPLRADLHFPQVEVRLGEVHSGQPLHQRFTFVNQGTTTVTIDRLSATCGCMTPRLDKRVYQPCESGSFVLEVNTLTQPAGPNRWRVGVHYNERDQSKTQELHLSATLVAEIRVEPARLAFSTAGRMTDDIVITDQRPLPFRVTSAQTSSPYLTTTIAGEGSTFRVHLEVKDSLPAGRHEEILSILTDDPGDRELRVPITIMKRDRMAVRPTPAAVNLTIPRDQPAPSRIVLLRGEDEEPVEIDKIEVDSPALHCRWAAGPGRMATLKVSVDQARVTDVLRGTVKVHVRKPATTVAIPVSCTIR